jgi:hypothetical protein
MKIRNLYLTVFLLSVICVLISSIDVNPDATMVNLFGYKIGVNFTHYLWVKVLGFAALFMYIFTPSKKVNEKTS